MWIQAPESLTWKWFALWLRWRDKVSPSVRKEAKHHFSVSAGISSNKIIKSGVKTQTNIDNNTINRASDRLSFCICCDLDGTAQVTYLIFEFISDGIWR